MYIQKTYCDWLSQFRLGLKVKKATWTNTKSKVFLFSKIWCKVTGLFKTFFVIRVLFWMYISGVFFSITYCVFSSRVKEKYEKTPDFPCLTCYVIWGENNKIFVELKASDGRTDGFCIAAVIKKSSAFRLDMWTTLIYQYQPQQNSKI